MSPGPVDHRDTLRNIARLEEMAAHAIVQGHAPSDAVRVAENWMATTDRAAALSGRRIQTTAELSARLAKLKGENHG